MKNVQMKKEMVRMCCGCGRIRVDGQWKKALATVPVERISHGFCDHCFAKTMSAVVNHRQHGRSSNIAV